MLPKLKVLFLCTGNSCRSQMAEGWARHLRSGDIEPSSAGVRPTRLDPRAVAAMAESGVNIAQGHSKSLDRLQGVEFDRVVTVCDIARESCPSFGGKARVTHAGFDDPPELAARAGTENEAMAHYRRVRDEIREFVLALPGSLDRAMMPGDGQ